MTSAINFTDIKNHLERPHIKKMNATAGETFTASQTACIAPYATSIDMFQTYANTSALVTEWVESDTGETDAALTVTAGAFGYGNQGMAITTTAGKDDQTITRTIASTDFTSNTLYVLGKASAKDSDFIVYISDGINAGSAAMTFTATDTFEWQSFDVDTTTFAKDATHGGGANVDITAVTDYGIAVADSSGGPTMNISGWTFMPATETYRMYLADANDIASMPTIGSAPTGGATSGSAYDFHIYSNIKAKSATTLIPGLLVYQSGTAGATAQFFNQAVGFTRQVLGIAISTTEYLVYSPGGEY